MFVSCRIVLSSVFRCQDSIQYVVARISDGKEYNRKGIEVRTNYDLVERNRDGFFDSIKTTSVLGTIFRSRGKKRFM